MWDDSKVNVPNKKHIQGSTFRQTTICLWFIFVALYNSYNNNNNNNEHISGALFHVKHAQLR